MKCVDLFGREYGWTIDDVRRLTLSESHELQRIIARRYRDAAAAARRAVRR